jgi:hypothetical protein
LNYKLTLLEARVSDQNNSVIEKQPTFSRELRRAFAQAECELTGEHRHRDVLVEHKTDTCVVGGKHVERRDLGDAVDKATNYDVLDRVVAFQSKHNVLAKRT